MLEYINDESGAVTVDWIVLTAATIGLGAAVMSSVGDGVMSLASLTSAQLGSTEITSYGIIALDNQWEEILELMAQNLITAARYNAAHAAREVQRHEGSLDQATQNEYNESLAGNQAASVAVDDALTAYTTSGGEWDKGDNGIFRVR